MDKIYPKPKVAASKCLGFSACRWDGMMIRDEFIERLKGYVDFVTVCPETRIGLGVPRDPIRVVLHRGEKRVMQPGTSRDLTDKMKSFTAKFLDEHIDIDGFILKDRSPSCGPSGVKVYPRIDGRRALSTDSGLFGSEVLRRFSHLPIETETRLKDPRIRDSFLTRLFKHARHRTQHASLTQHTSRRPYPKALTKI